MKNKTLKIVAAVAVIALACVEAFSNSQQNTRTAPRRVNSSVLGPSTPILTSKAASSSAKNTFGKLPLRFEKNQGQSDPEVQYIAKGGGYTLFLTRTEAVFRLNPSHSNPLKARQVGRNRSRKILAKQVQQASLVRMRLSGATVTPKIEAANVLPGTVNYLIGNDPRKWHTKVPTFGTVQFSGVYPGIDLVYYGNQRQLEYDFVVNPGGDPRKIAFEFDGATGVALDPSGDLKMDSVVGKLTARKPAVYQVQDGQRKPIDGKFVRRDGNKVGVELGSYDATKPVVIDPILDYSSYLGGSGDDEANAIAVDSQGFSYVAGDTTSVDFPTSGTSLSSAPNGTRISFVSKMNQTGTALVYSTYLGGTGTDFAMGIAVDANGQAYVDGLTSSANFPVTPANALQSSYGTGASFNVFLSKLSADGQSLAYSTFLGGTADDEGTGIAIDANQNAYLTGYASSSNFPTTAANAFQSALNSPNGNAFVARIDTTRSGNSSLIYSTFLGGSSPYSISQLSSGSFGGDGAMSIAVDANQNVFVVGEASSTDFPITAGTAFQTTGNANNSAFLTRLDTKQSGSNSLIYSTFLGGTGPNGDLGMGVALDLNGNAYVMGDAFSSDFPMTFAGTNSANGKAFVAKFNTNLSGAASLIYSTLVGGSGGEQGAAITVDPDGDAYIGGDTGSTDFPVTASAIQSTFQGTAWNGFLAVLKPDGSGLVYGTYLGGNGAGAGDTVWGLALDSHENLYIAGQTDSANFPTTQGAFQTGLNGSTDAFVTELTGIVTTPQISSVFPVLGGIGSSVAITGSSFGNSQGQSKVSFNGIAASVTSWSDGSILAKVPAGLSQGISTINVAVNQVASNGVQFTVTQPLFVTPNQATLVVGQTRSLQLLDENGASISNASWSFDDNSIAEIIPPANTGDPTLLQADAVGTTILLARFGDRTGTAKVSVLPVGTSFPIGTVEWEVPPLGSIGFYKTVQALRVDDNTPDLYAEDDGAYGGYGAIRALTADGQQKWIWPSTSTKTIPTLLAADDQGGAIYFASPDNIPGPFQSYCYVGRVDQNGNESWQYQESNCYEDYAIAPDGTIYLVEGDFQNNGTNVVTALDPNTGQIKFTVPLPGLSQGTTQNVTYMPVPGQPNTNGPYCTPGNTIGPSASNVGGANYGAISISSDGTAYVPLSGVSTVLDGQPCDSSPDTLNPGYTHLVNTLTASWTATASVYVLAIHPDGSSTIQTIDNRTNTGTDWGNAAGTEFGVGSLRPIPAAPGEIFLGLGPTLYHVSGSGTSKIPLPVDVGAGSFPDDDPLLVAQDGTVYVVGSALGSSTPESTLAAVDPNSGVKWTASTGMYTNLSTVAPDGSVAFQYHLPDFSKYLAVANSAGAVSPLFANPDGSDAGPIVTRPSFGRLPSYWTLGIWFSFLNDGGLGAITGSPMIASSYAYSYAGGSPEAQHESKVPIIHTFVPDPYVCLPNTSPCQPDPSSPKTLTDFLKDRYPGKAELLGFPLASATYPAFQKDIQKPTQAFGFIGHSFEQGAPATSVGLCFYIQDPQYKHDCIIQHDYFTQFDQPSNPTIKPEDVVKLQTQPTVIFIAACQTQDVFKSLWDIDQYTKGRALIIPQLNVLSPAAVNLLWGATVWTAILDSLLQGNSVADAVKAGNTAAGPVGSQYTWQVIGDGNVKIAKAPN